MTTQNRIPPTELTGLFGGVVKIAARRMLGTVPDSMGVLANHPGLLRASMGIGRKVDAMHELDRRLTTYAVMAADAYIGCSWCLDFNYYKTRDEGLDVDKARQVPNWREASVFTPLERTVMEYAEAMSQTPPAVTDELSDALLRELGPAALIELAAKVAFQNMSARMNLALGIHSDGFAEACELPPLVARGGAAAAAVGQASTAVAPTDAAASVRGLAS